MEYARGLTREAFGSSVLHQDAMIRNIEIIGEAASRLTEETRAMVPEVPWDEIVGMRHRLVHEYFGVNLDRVWETVETDLPRLARWLEPVVPSPRDSE